MRRPPPSTDALVHLVHRIVEDHLQTALQRRAGVGPLNGKGFADQIGYSRNINDPVIPGSSAVGDISPPNNFDEDGNEQISGGLGVEPVGVDYGNWPLQMFNFTHANARFANLDYYVGIPFVTRMRALDTDGGHLHRGIDGDGPKIPVSSIVLPDGESLQHFLKISDASITGATGHDADVNGPAPDFPANADRFAVWDDFEMDDQDTRWQVISGSAERRQDTNGNWRWHLDTDTLVRVKSPGFSFNDRVSVRLDVKWDEGNDERTLDIRLRSRVSDHGFSYVAGFSSTKKCYIGELDYSTSILNILQPLPSDFIIPNDSLVRTVEVMNQGTFMQTGDSDGHQMSVTLSRDDTDEEGYVEIYIPPDSAGALIDNFLLARGTLSLVSPHHTMHHANGTDPLDVKDLADSQGLLHAAAPGPHAATHEVGGDDLIDISLIGDAQGVRLTKDQYDTLTQDGDASLLHHHDNIAPVDLVSTPKPILLGATPGVSTLSSPADHAHLLPRWKMQGYVDESIGPGHVPDDSDFLMSDPVLVSYIPTMGGEFMWTGAGNGFVWRTWIAIANSADTDYNITLVVPVLVEMTLRIRTQNFADGDLMLQTYDQTNYAFNAEVTFRLPAGETTAIVLYGSGNGIGLKHVSVFNKEFDGDLFGAGKSLAWAPVEMALG